MLVEWLKSLFPNLLSGSGGGLVGWLPWLILLVLWLFPGIRATAFGFLDAYNPFHLMPKSASADEVATKTAEKLLPTLERIAKAVEKTP